MFNVSSPLVINTRECRAGHIRAARLGSPVSAFGLGRTFCSLVMPDRLTEDVYREHLKRGTHSTLTAPEYSIRVLETGGFFILYTVQM